VGAVTALPDSKDHWTVKNAFAHITHWKADVARFARGMRRPTEERGLDENEGNHLIYVRWHDCSQQEVLTWHWQVQEDELAAPREAPEEGSAVGSADRNGPPTLTVTLPTTGLRISNGHLRRARHELFDFA